MKVYYKKGDIMDFKLIEWDNTKDLHSYEVYEKAIGFAGKLVDKQGRTINCLGMPQDDMCMTWDYEKTLEGIKKEFEYLKEINSK